MNAAAFRHYYDYHFAANRKIWDTGITAITPEQFTRAADYSHGSVRDQVVHLMNVDEIWFSDMRGGEPPEQYAAAGDGDDRPAIRARWDAIEQAMRGDLAALRDEQLSDQPLTGEDKDLFRWQVLLHVVNHGTDHRAQLLRLLHDLGVQTSYQDYVFYAYEHPVGQ